MPADVRTTGPVSTEIYLGFVAEPELVMRAVADPEHAERAEMIGYTLGDGQKSQPLVGETDLRKPTIGADTSGGVLTIKLRQPYRLRPAGCNLASYAGTFVGLMRLPLGSAEIVESDVGPEPELPVLPAGD